MKFQAIFGSVLTNIKVEFRSLGEIWMVRSFNGH
jgi:hypothetical protein